MTNSTIASLWIKRFHPADANATRLVCFPYAGGSATFYHPFSAALSPQLEVLAIQYPGRQDRRREPFAESIAQLADAVVAELTAFADRPMAMFGHSMGAVLAFEVAARLEREGRQDVRAVFASGRRAPSRCREEDVHLRDDAGIVSELRRINGTDARLLGDKDMLPLIVPTVRADYRLIETYRLDQYRTLRSPIIVLRGAHDVLVTPDEAAAWREHTTGGFDLHTYDGDHFYLNEAMDDVAAMVARTLRRDSEHHAARPSRRPPTSTPETLR